MQKCSGCKQNGKYICTNCGVIQCDNCAKENLYICARCKHKLELLEESNETRLSIDHML